MGAKGAALLSVVAGVLVGIGGLTRYSFFCMIIPVALFLAIFGGPRRFLYCIAAVVAFALVISPWIARNYAVSGHALGTSTYNVLEDVKIGNAQLNPGFKLQRSLQPDLRQFPMSVYMWKLATNLLPVLQNDLFDLAGGWVAAFFLVSLLVGLRSPALRRFRYFVVGCVVVLAMTQALARTKLSEETPEINAENMLVLMAPLIVVYGVGMFYTLLENMNLPFHQMRYVVITGSLFW